MHFHLTQQNRIELSLLTRLGYSQRAVAVELGVSPSTICRELARNCQATGKYHATYARLATLARRLTANQRLRKLSTNEALQRLIANKLIHEQWSPDQIAVWLRYTAQAITVCAQTIYDWLYTSRQDLLKHLRSQKQHYRRTRANSLRQRHRAALLASRRIDRRPAGAAGRRTYPLGG